MARAMSGSRASGGSGSDRQRTGLWRLLIRICLIGGPSARCPAWRCGPSSPRRAGRCSPQLAGTSATCDFPADGSAGTTGHRTPAGCTARTGHTGPAARRWVFSGLRRRIWRTSARRCCGEGCHRPRRPARPGQPGGHRQVGRPVRRDALAIGKQDAGVREHHDAVAEQAPSLSGTRRHDAGCPAIGCARGRTGRLMLAHAALRSCCRR